MRVRRFDEFKRALEFSGIAGTLRMDANETALFGRQLEDIDAQLYRVQYPDLKGTLLVPVKSDVDPGAEEYTYRAMDYAGEAEPIANYADDLSGVDVQGKEVTSRIYSFGDSFRYSIQDLRRAKMAGLPLETERAMAAREVIARKLDKVIFLGHAPLNITGLANNANVSLVSVITGNWTNAGTTADQILADLFKLEKAIFDDSKGVETPDTLLLPSTRYSAIATKPLGDNRDKTVLDFFLAKAMFIKNVEHSYHLELADAEGDGPRAVCYKREPTKLQAIVPVEFETFPPQPKNLAFVTNCHMRCGGVAVRYPGSMRYMDGI